MTRRNHNGMDVANKTVLVTGANRGIGRALVNEALRRGARRVFAGSRGPLDIADDRVTVLTLDVTNASHIRRAVEAIDCLDVLINNAGVAIYDDLSNLDVIERHLQVNFLGMLRVTQALVPLLKRSRGALVNNLSLAALAPLPMIPAYSISKAAAFNMTQSLRALLASEGVTVHAVVLGPVDTDMNRGLEIPKASPEAAAAGIFDGLAQGEEEIFPDPASASVAEGWRAGAAKALERQFADFVPKRAASPGYTTSFAVDQSPEEVFDAIKNVRAWWSGEIEGRTDTLGAEFKYRYKDVHDTTQRITEWVPGMRVVWHVVDSHINFVKDRTEWNGTDIVFEIERKLDKTELRFTHVGLVPAFECYDGCSSAWGFYINDSLRSLITTGKGQPNQTEEAALSAG
jgi:NAD(P)-dependent dehydrogenase (short-subunit alcohol dehydrogenase family)